MRAYQFLPLALIYHAGGEIKGRTKLMKLTFLADQELKDRDDVDVELYDFISYDYGPFDKRLYEATEWLEEEELIVVHETYTIGGDERYNYRLTAKAKETFNEQIKPQFEESKEQSIDEGMEKAQIIYTAAENVVEEYDIPISNLIDRVYDEYPEYTENSVLI